MCIERQSLLVTKSYCLQGWVESIPKKGTFVHRNLPELVPAKF